MENAAGRGDVRARGHAKACGGRALPWLQALHRVMSWAAEQQQQQAKAGPPAVSQGTPQVVLVGHSRGGKLSVLAALPQPADPSPPSDGVAGPAPPRPAVQVAGLVLLDPADASFERMDAAR